MPLDDRIDAMRRHELWGELCLLSEHLYELADEIHELTLKWWDRDPDLVDAHYERCKSSSDQQETPPAIDNADDGDF